MSLSKLERYLIKKNNLCDTMGYEPYHYPETEEQINTLLVRVRKDREQELQDFKCEYKLNFLNEVENELHTVLEEITTKNTHKIG